jgi:ketosteroid isomerase-like protein
MRIVHGMRSLRAPFLIFLFGCVFLLGAMPAAAQRDKNKKKKDMAAAESAATTVKLPDEQQIDLLISEMLGAWQLGDIERLHQAYADDVSMVSGAWEPPVVGWSNYLANYQKQHARVQQVRMDRQNTYVRVSGNSAWACYQWDFSGVVDGQQNAARGQTTLVLERRNARWIIVHNHTSLIQAASVPVPAMPPPATPAPPHS